jgi:hypothetical protein
MPRLTTSQQHLNLSSLLQHKSVVWIDVSPDASQKELVDLLSIYTRVRGALDAPVNLEERRLVILEDLVTLEWIGCSVVEIKRFVRALTALCCRVRTI